MKKYFKIILLSTLIFALGFVSAIIVVPNNKSSSNENINITVPSDAITKTSWSEESKDEYVIPEAEEISLTDDGSISVVESIDGISPDEYNIPTEMPEVFESDEGYYGIEIETEHDETIVPVTKINIDMTNDDVVENLSNINIIPDRIKEQIEETQEQIANNTTEENEDVVVSIFISDDFSITDDGTIDMLTDDDVIQARKASYLKPSTKDGKVIVPLDIYSSENPSLFSNVATSTVTNGGHTFKVVASTILGKNTGYQFVGKKQAAYNDAKKAKNLILTGTSLIPNPVGYFASGISLWEAVGTGNWIVGHASDFVQVKVRYDTTYKDIFAKVGSEYYTALSIRSSSILQIDKYVNYIDKKGVGREAYLPTYYPNKVFKSTHYDSPWNYAWDHRYSYVDESRIAWKSDYFTWLLH
ncbi:MAG: hypothetical protein LBG82_08630 [Clostridiales Family XIII bacterium]|jgi:hypothetical protein|nr:hypothetical protein [Clostridiales Family XIII bacterium]